MPTPAPAAAATAPGPVSDDKIEAFLPPGQLDSRARRHHKIILVAIMAFGLAKGAYWVVLTQVWSPADEAQHYGYVESLARGHGIPTVGKDLLSDEVIRLMKSSADMKFRNEAYQPTNEDEAWGATRHQYEGIQGPTYYALMVPAYWVGAPFGASGSLYAIRLATVCLAMLVVPLTWLLARRLFPDQPTIWWLAPTVLVTIDSTPNGSVGNDTLVLVLGTAALLALLRSLDDPGRRWSAAWAGAAVSLTIMTKTTSLVLLPLSAMIVITWLVRRRPPWRVVIRWSGIVCAAAIATMAPWLLWNFHAYGAPSAAEQSDELTGALNLPTERSLDGLRSHLKMARITGLWTSQLSVDGSYRKYWEFLTVTMIGMGAIAALARRRWRDLGSLAWCGSALPLAFLSMEALVWIVFGGKGGPTGRHLAVALAPTSIAIAASAVLVFRERWGTTVMAGGLTGALIFAVPMHREVVRRTYVTQALPLDLAPVLSQTWSDRIEFTRSLEIEPGCPAMAFGLGVTQPIPEHITVTPSGASTTSGAQVTGLLDAGTSESSRLNGPVIPVYRIPHPVTGPLRIDIPGQAGINSSVEDRAPWVSFVDGSGDPVVVVYCSVEDPDEVAFDSVYPVLHPDWIHLGMLNGAPVAFAVAVGVGTSALLVWSVIGSLGDLSRRRRGHPEDSDPESRPSSPSSP